MPKFMVEYSAGDWTVIEAKDLEQAVDLAGDNAVEVKEMRQIQETTKADFVANLKRKLGGI